MSAVLLGLLTALCWGWADVLARFTGRALGANAALFAMMLAGSVGLSIWILSTGQPRPGIPSMWTVATSLLATLAMLLLYEAMRRGPVSLVSPTTGAYPAWALLIGMAFGIETPLRALLAMATTLAGVVLVACTATEPDQEDPPKRGMTFALAVLASLMFALTLLAGQQAILQDGATQMLWWGRTSAALLMALVVVRTKRLSRPPLKASLLALVQGLLDTLGLVSLFAAGGGLEGATATVCSSAFGVVTVVLARLLYKERISLMQGLGIGLVFAGVAALSAVA